MAARVAENGVKIVRLLIGTTHDPTPRGARGAPPHAVHFTLRFSAEVFPLVCNLFVLDLLALVEGRQTGPLYRRDMDENVLAAALRLNEPITFWSG